MRYVQLEESGLDLCAKYQGARVHHEHRGALPDGSHAGEPELMTVLAMCLGGAELARVSVCWLSPPSAAAVGAALWAAGH